uniref:Si:dkey-182g1.2 n=1 Tax=Cyprinus carpio TaxID=7962 RepID=A0A8C1YFL1_CYPCA
MVCKYSVLYYYKNISVFGGETDPVEIRELMEGDSVILDTNCITKLQKDDEIVWKFGSVVIATVKANNPLLSDTDDARFKDKLQINAQTGDLSIRNTRTSLSGLYEVKITNITHTTYRRFRSRESAILQHNIADIHNYDVIEWKFEDGETPIAQINKQTSKNPSYDETDERFRDRLQLSQTGSLTITNTRTTDSGLYKLQVQGTNIATKHRKFRVTVDEAGLSTGIIVLICVCVITLIVVVVGIYCRNKRQRQQGQY